LTGITSSQWTTTNTNDVYLPNSGNVGIGTTFTTNSALTVMNGNVGIGTWVTTSLLTIQGNNKITFSGISAQFISSNIYTDTSDNMYVSAGEGSGKYTNLGTNGLGYIQLSAGVTSIQSGTSGGSSIQLSTNGNQRMVVDHYGNVGIGSSVPGGQLDVEGTQAGIFYAASSSSNVNVGIGSFAPGQKLDVTGTVRATAFIGNGSALTGIGGMQWTTTNTNDVYLPNSGNVGIGTTLTTKAALTVMNGNVGIGTWVPAYNLQVMGTAAFQPTVVTVSQSATPAINVTNNNGTIYSITGLAQAITSMTPSGTPTNGAVMEIQITDNGTARAITWGSSYASTTQQLPATTVISTLLHVWLQYDSASSTWQCIGVA